MDFAEETKVLKTLCSFRLVHCVLGFSFSGEEGGRQCLMFSFFLLIDSREWGELRRRGSGCLNLFTGSSPSTYTYTYTYRLRYIYTPRYHGE